MPKPKEVNEYTIKPGAQLVVWIDGRIGMFVGQVTRTHPLRIKVQESGPLSDLKGQYFTILHSETVAWQRDGLAKGALLHSQKQLGRPVLSGLKTLGVTDTILHEILDVRL